MAKFCPLKHAGVEGAQFAVSIEPRLRGLQDAGLLDSYGIMVPEQLKSWGHDGYSWVNLTGTSVCLRDEDDAPLGDDVISDLKVQFSLKRGEDRATINSSMLEYLMVEIPVEDIPRILASDYYQHCNIAPRLYFILEARLTFGS